MTASIWVSISLSENRSSSSVLARLHKLDTHKADAIARLHKMDTSSRAAMDQKPNND